jgi:glycosyltransferase involved in cell wall biosynthesis
VTDADPTSAPRLGVYVDAVYDVVRAPGADSVSTDRAFVLFVCAVGSAFERLVLFGRARERTTPSEYLIPSEIGFVPLPHYSNLRRIPEVLRAVGGTLRAFWRNLDGLDVLWVFGPHPFAVALAAMGLARGKRVIIGVRQDSVKLYRARLSGWPRIPGLAAVYAIEWLFRRLARKHATTVQGSELAIRYGGERPGLLTMNLSVVTEDDVLAEPPDRQWDGELELLTVGRLETEKNPRLLESLRPGRYRLTWVGRGPLESDVFSLARQLGVDTRIDFRGYVPFGPGLLALYRRAHIFLHVSLSEGMPMVLIEALASGTPLVATDVGGVRAALDGGDAGLLVPAGDLEALVEAVLRLTDDHERRDALVRHGLTVAQSLSMDAQARSVLDFMRSFESKA